MNDVDFVCVSDGSDYIELVNEGSVIVVFDNFFVLGMMIVDVVIYDGEDYNVLIVVDIVGIDIFGVKVGFKIFCLYIYGYGWIVVLDMDLDVIVIVEFVE